MPGFPPRPPSAASTSSIETAFAPTRRTPPNSSPPSRARESTGSAWAAASSMRPGADLINESTVDAINGIASAVSEAVLPGRLHHGLVHPGRFLDLPLHHGQDDSDVDQYRHLSACRLVHARSSVQYPGRRGLSLDLCRNQYRLVRSHVSWPSCSLLPARDAAGDVLFSRVSRRRALVHGLPLGRDRAAVCAGAHRQPRLSDRTSGEVSLLLSLRHVLRVESGNVA